MAATNGSSAAGSAAAAARSGPVSSAPAAAGPGAGLWIIAMTTAASRNDAASTAKANPVLVTAMAAPAIGGPTMEASCIVPWSSALPDGRRSGSRVRGRNACWAGRYSASAAPKTAPSSASSGRVAVSVRTRAAIAPTTAPRTMWAVSIRPRDGRRSASTPNGTRSTARGTAIAISTVPSARPEPVSEITSHDRAMNWNWSPTTEIASLPQSRRKSRAASARRNGRLRTRLTASVVIRGRSARRRPRRRPRGSSRDSPMRGRRGRG